MLDTNVDLLTEYYTGLVGDKAQMRFGGEKNS